MSNHTKRGTRAHWGTGAGGGRAEGREEARGSLFLKREGKSGSEPGAWAHRGKAVAGSQLSIKDKISPPAVEGKSPPPHPHPHPPRQEKAICSQACLREAWPGDNGMGCTAGSVMILCIRAHVQNGCGFFFFFSSVFFCRSVWNHFMIRG